MKRRTFLKISALSAVAVSVPGFIRFNGRQFTGDCETTTDILGPFYRPGAPLRSDLLVRGDGGTVLNLSGTIYNDDCSTPLKQAVIELWHCSPDAVYDNTSDEFLYRGRQIADENGFYRFRTIIPVPYDAGSGYRPAHYHLLISASGYQDLITQLYFTGDPYLDTDPYSSSPQAKKRILGIKSNDSGEKEIHFDIVMKEHLQPDDAVLDKLSGKYYNIKNPEEYAVFFKSGHQLWMKYYSTSFKVDVETDLFYTGNNRFNVYGTDEYYEFTLLKEGGIKLSISNIDANGSRLLMEAMKEK